MIEHPFWPVKQSEKDNEGMKSALNMELSIVVHIYVYLAISCSWLRTLGLGAYIDDFQSAGLYSMDQLKSEQNFTIKVKYFDKL